MSEKTADEAQFGTPSAWVTQFLGGIRPGGQVLDVACGGGRHLRAARAAGYRVTGVDRDLRGVADLSGIADAELVQIDLEMGPQFPLGGRFGAGTFDGVIVTNYLWRPILTDIVTVVRGDGVLIYETFALGNERVGRGKPSNPDFLLRPGELLEAIRPHLVAIAFEHVTLGSGPSGDNGLECVVQRIVAVGGEHPWLRDPPKWPRGLAE